jgi:hypothetical protein
MSVGGLLMPPAGMDDIEMPNRSTLTRETLVAAILPRLGTEKAFDRMQSTTGRIAEITANIHSLTGTLAGESRLLYDDLLLARGVREARDRFEDAD